MMKITGLSHLFKWENLHNWWLTKYFFAPLYIYINNAKGPPNQFCLRPSKGLGWSMSLSMRNGRMLCVFRLCLSMLSSRYIVAYEM